MGLELWGAAARPHSWSALWNTARLRRWVVAAAYFPAIVRAQASRASLMVAASSSAVAGTDAAAIHASALAASGGGVRLRVPG